MTSKKGSYWRWLLTGGDKPGILRFFDLWLPVHICVGCCLALLVPVSLAIAANSVLLPLSGIFIGLSFAWGGNAQALLQSDEIGKLIAQHSGGFEDYLYVFQSAILSILVTLVAWGIAGFGVFEQVWPTVENTYEYFGVRVVLFFLASLTLRECWHVVLGAQELIKARFMIKQMRD